MVKDGFVVLAQWRRFVSSGGYVGSMDSFYGCSLVLARTSSYSLKSGNHQEASFMVFVFELG